MRRTCLLTILLAMGLLAATAEAQSPFSLRGLGQNVEAGTARDWGRGWGLADRDTLAPGTLNPAALADLRFVQLLFTGMGERALQEGATQDRVTWRTTVPNVRLAVPLRSGSLAMQAGFNIKRTFVHESFTTYDVERFDQTFTVEETYSRSGNLFEIPLGLAWRPLADLAVAASFNLVRGPVEDRIVQLFGGGALVNDYVSRLELEGHTVTVAALWTAGPLSLGASLTPGYDLDIERTVSLAAVAGEVVTEEQVAMPPDYRAGLALDLGGGWRLGADGTYAAYGEIGDGSAWGPGLRDEWSIGVGLERQLLRSERGRDYRAPIRLGFVMRRWAHEVGGAPVDERVVSVGTGVPFRNWLGTMDMSVSYAWIGSDADNGFQSQALRLGLSISGLERLVF